MNTNIDQFVLPDERALEELANQFFAEFQNKPPEQKLPSFDSLKSLTNQEGVLQQGNVADMGNPQTSLPDPAFAGKGLAPASVTPSGVSPTAAELDSPFTIAELAINLPDPLFAGRGILPQSVSGFGASPTGLSQVFDVMGHTDELQKGTNPNLFPAAGATHLPLSPAFGTQEVTSYLLGYQPAPQLLNFGNAPLPSTESYYFLKGKDSFGPAAQAHPFATQQFHQKDAYAGGLTRPPFDVNLVRNDFPILREQVNGRSLVWLDNAATTQKPRQVIERISYFYEHENSNIHRAAHELAARATDAYESARQKVQHFINAGSPNEIVFVRGTTEAINLVAQSWGEQHLRDGDEIIVTHLEHHANIVPWQQLAQRKGLKLRVIPVDETGQVLLDEYAKLLNPKTKLVAFTLVSNALGTVTPAKAITEMAHAVGAKVLADGAQSVSHLRTDVRALDADWFVFSGHKVFGPTGIGVLYGKEALLNETQPWQGGGNMIADVTFERTQYQNAPARFEAGTGNIADAVGLGAAIDYVSKLGIDAIGLYEHYLLEYTTKQLKDIPGLRLIGTAKEKTSVISFVLEGYKTEEVGAELNKEGIAVRSGHHCAQPILRRFGLESTVRPSLAFYNTCADVDRLAATVWKLASSRKY